MAKCFILFMLIALFVIDHSITYGRHHSDTHGPRDTHSRQAVAHHMRPAQHHNHRQLLPAHTLQHIHKRTPHVKNNRPRVAKARRIRQSSWQENVPPDSITSAEEREEAEAALRRYIHIQRHMAHQQEHLRHHQEEYQNTARQSVSQMQEWQSGEHQQQQQQQREEEILSHFNMRMPRIWQHLGGTADVMLSDAPNDDSVEPQRLAVSLPFTETDSDSNELDDLLAPTLEAEYSNSLESSETQEKEQSSNHQEQSGKSDCPKCESSRRIEHISEEELTQLRIEYVKQQILEKLRLKERPNVSAVGLPKPIKEGTTIDEEEDDSAKNKDVDDYYARTSKKFIFLQRGKCNFFLRSFSVFEENSP